MAIFRNNFKNYPLCRENNNDRLSIGVNQKIISQELHYHSSSSSSSKIKKLSHVQSIMSTSYLLFRLICYMEKLRFSFRHFGPIIPSLISCILNSVEEPLQTGQTLNWHSTGRLCTRTDIFSNEYNINYIIRTKKKTDFFFLLYNELYWSVIRIGIKNSTDFLLCSFHLVF